MGLLNEEVSEEVFLGGLGKLDLRGIKWDKVFEISERVSLVLVIMRVYR